MSRFKSDLHIHTCLSPCGDLDMSPKNIIRIAKEKELDMIAITDHNSTLNVKTCLEIGTKQGIYVIPGCEVNTREEVHCLCYFPNLDAMESFQQYLDKKMPKIKNDPLLFGYQVAVDENDFIIYEEERMLYAAIDDSIDKVEQTVHSIGGIFVPAHIDRQKNSIFSQLGFIPFKLKYDALEISKRTSPREFLKLHPEIATKPILRSSDAHFPDHIASVYTCFEMPELNWECFTQVFSDGADSISKIIEYYG